MKSQIILSFEVRSKAVSALMLHSKKQKGPEYPYGYWKIIFKQDEQLFSYCFTKDFPNEIGTGFFNRL
ncbi:hypothetical protein [Bacillus salacetis]|uniref:hypothetical protein n=1 Tax=Bacillus salacetis TaxID=2315464 RepID=UPI001443E74D|nr:hypothetical protein [Bacillus salacetis]